MLYTASSIGRISENGRFRGKPEIWKRGECYFQGWVTWLRSWPFSFTHPIVSQQALQFVAVPLSHVPPPTQLQFGQEIFEGGGAVTVPAGWVTRTPLHDLFFQDLLNSTEQRQEVLLLLRGNCSRLKNMTVCVRTCPGALLQQLCLCADTPAPQATGNNIHMNNTDNGWCC